MKLTLLLMAIILSVSLVSGCGSETAEKPEVEKSASSSSNNWKQEVEALRAKGDVASLEAARERLRNRINTQPQEPQAHVQLGLTCYDEARVLNPPKRETLGELYQEAIEHLEIAKALLAEERPTLQFYQTLWVSYRNLALLPVTFNQGTDPDQGVVPLHVKQMKKALEVFEEARATYPSDPAVNAETANQLQADLKALEAVYLANVQRQWKELNESGYRRPKTTGGP